MLEKIPAGRSEVDLESRARSRLLLDPLLAGRLLLLFDAFHYQKKKERKREKDGPRPLIARGSMEEIKMHLPFPLIRYKIFGYI